MSVVVYSKPGCMQCEQTKNYLKKKGVDFSVVDISVDQEAFDRVAGMGYKNVPVVVAGDQHWYGFIPSKLGSLSA